MRKINLLLLILVASLVKAQIIHVPADYPTIQQGIDAAQPGDTVLVADGTYYEQVKITSKKPLLVASHFIMDGDSTHKNNTIIDGSQLQGNNRSVVEFRYVDSTAILAGFTIQRGKGTFTGSELTAGGIYLISSGAKIMHNRIINNVLNGGPAPFGQHCNVSGGAICAPAPSADWIVMSDNLIKNNICISDLGYAFGAGGYIRNDIRYANNVVTGNQTISSGSAVSEGGGFCPDGTSTNTITFIATNNKFYNNLSQSEIYSDGAGLITVRSKNYITGNQFINNISSSPSSWGAGIELALCTVTGIIENNLFQGNQANVGSAIDIWIQTADTMFIRNNTFIENEGINGAAIYSQNGTMMIENNVFNHNSAQSYGGSIYLIKDGENYNTARILNNTFSGNTAGIKGGAIVSVRTNPYLLNNIFWDNTATAGSDVSVISGFASIAYCNTDDSKISGEARLLDGVICHNPLFCDTTCLTVYINSPCLNTGAEYYVFGENDTVFAPINDIVYQPRPINGIYDMGAYEIDILESVYDINGVIDLSVYPNPSGNILKCSYSLKKDSKVTLAIYDILGTLKHSREFKQSAGEHTVPVNMEGFTKGVYLLKLQVGDQVATRKIIKN